MYKLLIILKKLKKRDIEIEDAIFELGLLEESNWLIDELQVLEEDDENFEREVQSLIALVEDSDCDVHYRKASIRDIVNLVDSKSVKELDEIIRNAKNPAC